MQKQKTTTENVSEAAQQVGLALMTFAATFGMIHLPENHNKQAIAPSQLVFEHVNAGAEHGNEAQRREREETGPHYISYSNSQRTPGRTGRV